ncbi:MAG: hypothetical protein U5K30_16740 [Acidimicrobiales bacterium]|nr:hypothetical protein [Acidimicrobiales bacterium]
MPGALTAAARTKRSPEERRRSARGRPIDRSPAAEFDAPYGLVGATAGYAMIAQRYLHDFGARPEQLARIAVHQRDNACAHPEAVFTDPITVDDVLASEMICDPLRLLEIVMPVAGGAAVVVTAADRRSTAPTPRRGCWVRVRC